MRQMLALLLLLPTLASAELRPGLWEFTNQAQSGGQAMPDMQELLGQMQNMPAEQRQMMEQMLKQQGVQLGSGGVQLCISEATAKGQNIPLQDPNSGCSHEVTGASQRSVNRKCEGNVHSKSVGAANCSSRTRS